VLLAWLKYFAMIVEGIHIRTERPAPNEKRWHFFPSGSTFGTDDEIAVVMSSSLPLELTQRARKWLATIGRLEFVTEYAWLVQLGESHRALYSSNLIEAVR
jgi:hypothetical protein